MNNPILTALRSLSDEQRTALSERLLAAILDGMTRQPPMVAAWWIELQRLVQAPLLAGDTNHLYRCTSLLSDTDRAALVNEMHTIGARLSDGALRYVIGALGLLLATTPPYEAARETAMLN